MKTRRPDIYYCGIDVADYKQTVNPSGIADKYVIAPADRFDREIGTMENGFDAVISSHNLEHCDKPYDVLLAMLLAIRKEGRLYLSFPCAESVRFPQRKGTLNFCDDPTHTTPPDFDKIIDMVRSNGFVVDFAARRYRPLIPFLLGLALEPLGIVTGRKMPLNSTWALYGFESIIWARRT